jgi:hypothetical protein
MQAGNQGDCLMKLINLTGAKYALLKSILFEITSGALQVDNTAPDAGVFAPNGVAVLRIAGTTLPSDFSTGFAFSSTTTIDILGIPEPNSLLLAAGLGVVSLLFRQKSEFEFLDGLREGSLPRISSTQWANRVAHDGIRRVEHADWQLLPYAR